MKALLSLSILTLVSFNAFGCDAPEAQFIARVSSVNPSAHAGSCEVKFSQIVAWNENALCPLDVEETQNRIVMTSCGLQVGEDASGYMVQKTDGHLEF